MPEVRLIDANALLKSEIERCHCVPLVCTTDLNGIACECNSLKNVLARQPTIDAEPVRHGRWIVRGQEIYCSECNEESLYNPFGASKFSRFCPNCGADMQEVSEDAAD